MKQITENTILFMLLIIGGLGLLLHYNNKNADADNDFEIVLMQNESSDASSDEQFSKKLMKISGTQEVGFPLNFEIGNLTSNVQYVLELGNGDRLQLSHKKKSYIYEEPGNYNVKLIAINHGEKELLHSTKLRITQNLAAGPSYGGSAN